MDIPDAPRTYPSGVGPDDVTLGPGGGLVAAPRTGASYLQFTFVRATLQSDAELTEERLRHGSAVQLLTEYSALGLSFVRQSFDADAELSSLWQGPFSYLGLDGANSQQADPGAVTTGWPCPPAPFNSGADASVPIGDWVSACSFGDDDTPPGSLFTTEILDDFALHAEDLGLTAIVQLYSGHSADNDTLAAEPEPPLTCDRDHGNDQDRNGFPWTFLLNTDADGGGGVRKGFFWAGNAERWVDGEVENEDRVLQAFVANLMGSNPSAWTSAGLHPYVQIANELVRDENDCCIRRGRHLAWLLLRSSELIQQATGTSPGVDRPWILFPGISSINNAPSGESACPSSEEAEDHSDKVYKGLDQTFFHIARSALIAQQGGSAHGPEPSRFTGVLGAGVAAWDLDGDGVPIGGWYGFVFTWMAVRALLFMLVYVLSTGEDTELPPELEELMGELPAGPADLKYENLFHRLILQVWSSTVARLTPPFDIMDFHWYNSGGAPGQFLYLSEIKPHVEAIRLALTNWWSNGAEIPIWCTETGISSDQNVETYGDIPLATAEGGLVCWGVLNARIDESTDPSLGDAAANDDMGTHDSDGCKGAAADNFEFRIDPMAAALDWGDSVTGTSVDCGAVWDWPSWMFTSEREQAVQVWTRLSYLFGCGVEKVFWDSPNPPAVGAPGTRSGLFGYGLTTDTTVRSANDVGATAGCGLVEWATDDDDVPAYLALEYPKRSKKMASCALWQWNRYLDRFAKAALILDGSTGYYAVAFKRSEVTEVYPEYPYAIVAWADGRTYAAPLVNDPLVEPTAVPVDLSVTAEGAVLDILSIPTLPIPNLPPSTPSPCGVDTFELEFGDGTRYDGEANWEFDSSGGVPMTNDGEVTTATLALAVSDAPRLWLLKQPAWVTEPVDGTVLFRFSSF